MQGLAGSSVCLWRCRDGSVCASVFVGVKTSVAATPNSLLRLRVLDTAA